MDENNKKNGNNNGSGAKDSTQPVTQDQNKTVTNTATQPVPQNQNPVVNKPMVNKPVVNKPDQAVSTPGVSTPVGSIPVGNTPAVSAPVVSTPTVNTPKVSAPVTEDSLKKVDIGLVGLGKIGSLVAQRLRTAKFDVIGYDVRSEASQQAEALGVLSVPTLEKIAEHAPVIWFMVPHDKVDAIIEQLTPKLAAGTIIIDGGNSNFKDTARRAQALAPKNVLFLDCGISGGLAGGDRGFSLTIGGDKAAVEKVDKFFAAVAAPAANSGERGSYLHVGPSGSGHYVKMMHNGIEYALLQAYAEGLHVLREGSYKELDLVKIIQAWQPSSIIRSHLLELIQGILVKDQTLKDLSGGVEETGMGAWAVEEARTYKIPILVIEDAVEIRTWSRNTGGNWATKLIGALRTAFGGHAPGEFKKKPGESKK